MLLCCVLYTYSAIFFCLYCVYHCRICSLTVTYFVVPVCRLLQLIFLVFRASCVGSVITWVARSVFLKSHSTCVLSTKIRVKTKVNVTGVRKHYSSTQMTTFSVLTGRTEIDVVFEFVLHTSNLQTLVRSP